MNMTTLGDVKIRTLALIEELNKDKAALTDDPDIQGKLPFVIDQVQHELARIKKIAEYVELAVEAGQTVRFADIAAECGKQIYQLDRVTGPAHDLRANNTILKFRETGTAAIDCFVYPTQITETTPDSHVMELSEDALNILPYGVAADLLKSDVSTNYGSIYASRYEEMRQRLDPRNAMPGISIEGGVDF